MNLYTIILGFSDHRQGMGQYEAESHYEALKLFIHDNGSLKGFDRKIVEDAINPNSFIHLKNFKGAWIIRFDMSILSGTQNPEGEDIYGGYVLQADPNGPERAA